jgi:PilZ domain-containing protein
MPAENFEDKRQFHRILYTANAILQRNNDELDCKVLDISLQGCLLQFQQPWHEHLDSDYTLLIKLSENITIRMELAISHIIGERVGFKCEHIDIDSISQLRRLVELNLGDYAILERDLLALTGIHTH